MYYLMTYPSVQGMGSDSDIFLVTEENLRRLITEELRKKSIGKNYSELYTGSWTYEGIIGGQSEEIFQDIIDTRLRTCSTYARCSDLVILPEDVPVTITEEHFTDSIFRIFNQFDFERDVIVHDAKFFRYVLDLERYENIAGLKDARYFEFINFDFKGILMNHFMWDKEEVIEMRSNKIERIQQRLAGKKVPARGYIDDFLDIDDKMLKDMAKELEIEKRVVAHLKEEVPLVQDDYYRHLYMADYGLWNDMFRQSIEKDERNHTEYTYHTLLASTFACVCSGYGESTLPHRFDEIFKGECNLEYLLCSHTGSSDTNTFGTINVQSALESVFGYD